MINIYPFYSINPPDLYCSTKEEIKDYYLNTNFLYESLFSLILPEHVYKNPDPLRRSIVFYFGHTSVFYVLKLIQAGLIKPINENFEKQFSKSPTLKLDEINQNSNQEIWPELKDIVKYRQNVTNRILKLIEEIDLDLPINNNSSWWVILMGCEYERIHYETITLLIKQLDVDCVKKPDGWSYAPSDNSVVLINEFVKVLKNKVTLGKNMLFPTFGWDYEYGSITLDVNGFEATKFLITNGQFLEFVRDKGYEQDNLWSCEGLKWRNTFKAKHPLFFKKIINQNEEILYRYRAMFEIVDMPLDWPVECNYHEANAYINWLNLKDKDYNHRFLREKEYITIRGRIESNKKPQLNDENNNSHMIAAVSNNTTKIGNLNLLFLSPTPVNYFKPNSHGFYDTYGNLWEYTQDNFRLFPGFVPHYLSKDKTYSLTDYDHSLLLGSSWSSNGLSCSSFIRFASARNLQHNAGFRVVREKKETIIDHNNVYEQKKCIGEYISSFYYNSPNQLLNINLISSNNESDLSLDSGGIAHLLTNDYGTRVANEAISYFKKINPKAKNGDKVSAFDLGCGIGKTSFYLATYFGYVKALDYSTKFIEICNELKEKGKFHYEKLCNGDNFIKSEALIPDYIDRKRVDFIVGDAMNLPPLIGPFDIIVASNLIDRLKNPLECLINLRSLLTNEGIVVLTSPYTWLEQFTEKENWIGGRNDISTFDALKEIMNSQCFELIDEKNLVFICREHERKYQLVFPHLTVWKKI